MLSKNPTDPIKFHQWFSNDKTIKLKYWKQLTICDFVKYHTFGKCKEATHLETLISNCDAKNIVYAQ